MPWHQVKLRDGETYEVRHTIDRGFKARRARTVMWTDGSPTLVGALRDAIEGPLDSEGERDIAYAAARLMETSFSNIPSQHGGQ